MPQLFSDNHKSKIINGLGLDKLLEELPLFQYREVEKIIKGQKRQSISEISKILNSSLGSEKLKDLGDEMQNLIDDFVQELSKDFEKAGKPKLYDTNYKIDMNELIDTFDIVVSEYAIDMYNNISNIADEIEQGLIDFETKIEYEVKGDEDDYKYSQDKIINDIYNRNLVNSELKVLDNLGRAFSLATWSEREISTKILNDMQESLYGEMQAYNHNLVIINYNVVCSPLCINRQNKKYYMFGRKYKDLLPLEPELWSNGGGLFHPYCRHYINAYFPELSDEPVIPKISKEETKRLYENDQKLKYIKRNKKKYYERKQRAKAIDNDSYESNLKLWKQWIQREKDFTKNML